ncbi:hypothetical protein Z517_04669 [Fonsecaea pedrosoi CBS 271.37]|uniref:Ubiquitin-like domain-containing protein n=1 Tax=Fonsecaea pedrosoi CBS 271.37 TaxID=1442368 RepID=A0A0D2GL44_9EURO|nr:uncharacterized protein Z517_04669 [Fonsecaea pedrosoi CBS 271.37]KIW81643.1 hypothetical protein Z517_04669 [Fonsecaea pedrosoi CBS 271.37]
MASSSPAPQQPAQPSDLPPLDQDHVHLRITYLVTGNPRPPHYLGSLNLNTTISALKEKIQTELPEHPSPSEQRLIYQGRPLLRNDASLREILRIEPGAVPDILPYTVHIVIQSPQNISQPQQPSNSVLNPPPPPPLHPGHQHADFASPFRAAETSANRLQESLVRIQQQIEANRADLRTVQQRIALQHNNLGGPPNLMNGQVNVNGQPLPAPIPQTFALDFHFGLPPDQRAQNQQPPVRLNPQPHHLPPHTSTPTHTVQEFQGPSGQRMTVVSEHMSLVIPTPDQAPGSGQPATQSQPPNPSTQRQQNNIPPAPTPTTFAPPIFLFPSSNSPIHVPSPSVQNHPSIPQTSNTMAWLLSSPMGPQAFLFAPGHGYFSTLPSRPPQVADSVSDSQVQGNEANAIGGAQPIQAGNFDHPDANHAIIRANQPLPVPVLAQAQQNGEDFDLFAFIIQRGWLFLRLYLFMFVFSEPGTWKRWFMILVAAFICLQPPDGPLTHLLAAARRHLDNLIGPPPPQPPPEAAAQQQNPAAIQPGVGPVQAGAGVQRPANIRGATTMTPQEAIARLEEGQNHDPRSWRDTLYRAEQSIALFLASLIPGVGERHVRAREEARREEQRRIEERSRAENEAAAQRQGAEEADAPVGEGQGSPAEGPKPEVGVEGSREQSTSTSVEVRDGESESAELRNRIS